MCGQLESPIETERASLLAEKQSEPSILPKPALHRDGSSIKVLFIYKIWEHECDKEKTPVGTSFVI